MIRVDLIPKTQTMAQAHYLRALFVSFSFHGLALGLLLGLAFLDQSHRPPTKSGSAPGAATITLSTMVIVSPPPEAPPAPTPAKPAPEIHSAPSPDVTSTTSPRETEIKPKPPVIGVPVLAAQRTMVESTNPAKSEAPSRPAISHSVTATAESGAKAATAAAPSSYSPGPNVFPHPPFPPEARDLQETGTVVMNVQFGTEGEVTQAKVEQSSGVPILDNATRSFIRGHWHSAAYAGQTVSVPVQYSLENF